MSVARAADDVVAIEPAKRRKVGPWIPIASLAITSMIFGSFVAIKGFQMATFIELTRALTRVSFLVFILVFVTRPLHDLFGNRTTAWLFANRRYLGLTFAVWHLMHWPILASMMIIVGPNKFWAFFGGFAIPAGCVLLVITLLAATSNNGSQRVLGKRAWSTIHTAGIYIIWGWFAKVYVLSKLPRVQTFAEKPYLFVYVAILFAAMALRLVMATRRVLRTMSR